MNQDKSNLASKMDLIFIRPAVMADKPFILSTWLKGLRFGNIWYRLIDDKIYFRVYHAVIEKLISTPGVTIKVACLKDDPEVILGYVVYQGDKVHWVQVKKAWRNIGIARALTPSEITTTTHLTEVGRSIFLKKKWVFNPFLFI